MKGDFMTELSKTILEPQQAFVLKPSAAKTMLMLFSRILIFLCLQLVIFAVFSISGVSDSLKASGAWWPFVVTVTNLICAVLLYRLLKGEGRSYFEFFKFPKEKFGKELLWALLFFVIAGPISMLPNMVLGNTLFGSYITGSALLFQPLPMWAAVTQLVVFPLTMALGELPVYFGYVMPRIEALTKSKALGTILPAILLSLQHMALPLVPDWRFILWRGIMFLPFAIYIGIVIRYKPRLMPFILVGHVLIDISTAVLVLTGV